MCPAFRTTGFNNGTIETNYKAVTLNTSSAPNLFSPGSDYGQVRAVAAVPSATVIYCNTAQTMINSQQIAIGGLQLSSHTAGCRYLQTKQNPVMFSNCENF